MNLFYLKAKINKLCVFCVLLFGCLNVSAMNSIPNESFSKICANSDAYVVHTIVEVIYHQTWPLYSRQVSINYKIVINNMSGVDEYGFITLSNNVIRKLKSIEVKTLKTDGTIVELDSSIVFEHHATKEKTAGIDYPISGIEPGDTIEIHYQYIEDLKSHEMMDIVNPHMYIPVLRYEYSVRSNPNLLVRYKTYNGFPEPEVEVNDSMIYCGFKMSEVKAISKNEYACLPCELPYLYYSMEENNRDPRTWKDIYNQEFNIITQPMLLDSRNSLYYKRWKNEVINEAKDSSKYYQFELLHDNIINSIQMDDVYSNEFIKSNGYFLKEKRFDPISIRRLYRQILEDLEIEYYAVFAKDKRAGSIDPYYIRKGEFDKIFFAYVNEDDKLILLYPHEISFKYLINEIPTSLYDTEAVIVKPIIRDKLKKNDKFIGYDLELAAVDSVKVELISLPGMDANNNYSKHIVYCEVDLEKKSTSFRSQYSISGGLSTDIRSYYSMINDNEELGSFYDAIDQYDGFENPLVIDSITKTKLKTEKPFTFSVNTEGRLEGSLSFLGQDMVSISLEDLIQHHQIESEEDSAEMNFYLDYSYSDFLMFKIGFPCDIEVLGIENYKQDIQNEYGEYSFDISLVGENQFVIQSNYKILKNTIPKNDYIHIKRLNNQVLEVKNQRILVKLLSN